jgi:hypothetical protein
MDVVFSQFKKRLASHRKESRNHAGWINWTTSAARQMLIEDLQPGGLLYEKTSVTEEEAFEFYSTLPEFTRVVKSQFMEWLKTHRKQANEQLQAAHEDIQALLHDRALHPRQSHNAHGEPVFDMSPAKLLLREDVCDNMHTPH